MYDSSRTEFYKKFIEMLMAIGIIAIVISAALPIYRDTLKKVQVFYMADSSYCARLDSFYYHALYGTWPENKLVASEGGVFKTYVEKDNTNTFIKDVTIANGAVTLHGKGKMEGNRLTLRPAVPEGDPLGPVHWRCGIKENLVDGFILQGDDQTNIDRKFIYKLLR